MSELDADLAMRAITNDGAFRIITLRTTALTRSLCDKQRPSSPHLATLLTELATGAVLVRETMAPDLNVQIYLRGQDGSNLIADTHPDGMTRGLLSIRETPDPLTLGPQTQLQVTRVLPGNRLHQGIIETTDEHGISGALTSYMLHSEQITSWIEVHTCFDDGLPAVAGGFIVQILPEVTEEGLRAMTSHLEALPPFPTLLRQTLADPDALMHTLMNGIEHTILERRDVHFGCNCSHVRFLSAIATIARQDIQELVDEGQVVSTTCDYCGASYSISTEQLRSLLQQA
jgi:molecular chaperone Hsp33